MSEPVDAVVLRARINAETAQIAWTGLQRFFAQGRAVYVHPAADLVDVAVTISADEASELERLLANGTVQSVTDQQAREWLAADAVMWSVVIRPWVLVQPVLAKDRSD